MNKAVIMLKEEIAQRNNAKALADIKAREDKPYPYDRVGVPIWLCESDEYGEARERMLEGKLPSNKKISSWINLEQKRKRIAKVKESAPRKDLTGQRFGLLTIRHPINKGEHGWKYCAICDCGKMSYPSDRSLLNGGTNSCGCYATALTKARNGQRHKKLSEDEKAEVMNNLKEQYNLRKNNNG